MCAETLRHPVWVHFGTGNIFRAYIARLMHDLLNDGHAQSGIIAAALFDSETIESVYTPHDNLILCVRLDNGSTMKSDVVASVAGTAVSIGELESVFRNPSLELVSLTITEKGYDIRNIAKGIFPSVAALLFERYRAGGFPLAIVSMDNCSGNGGKAKDAVLAAAAAFGSGGFIDYLESVVTYPWTMIDKITPGPSDITAQKLGALGLEDMTPCVTSRGTHIAPFVNAEIPEYLVIEDDFPNGRPALEKAGVFFTDRETVKRAERMKVTACLKPLHTALAVFGCLLGYTSISAEMQDPELQTLARKIGEEGLKTTVDPGIFSPAAFLREVLDERFPNPYIPDTPQRIAADTSQKIPIRYGETIKAYAASGTLSVNDLTFIPLSIAGWLRYLLGIDDNGNEFKCSPDPMLHELQEKLQNIKCGTPPVYAGEL